MTSIDSTVRRALLTGLAAILASPCGQANPAPGTIEPGAVEVVTVAEMLVEPVSQGGSRRFVPAVRVREGEVIYYTLRIRNRGQQPLPDVEVIKAVPRNTRYIADSASAPGADVSFSTDGGLTFGRPGQLRSTDANAGPMPAGSYTHIRWRLRYPLPAGAVALARFRAVFG